MSLLDAGLSVVRTDSILTQVAVLTFFSVSSSEEGF